MDNRASEGDVLRPGNLGAARVQGHGVVRVVGHPNRGKAAKRKRELQRALRQKQNSLAVFTLGLAGLVLLGGCIIDNDRVRVDSFEVNPDGTFVYAAQTNTVMKPNEDGEAEQIRRGWLAEELVERDMCPSGYVVQIRRLVPVPPPSNAHDVIYTGRCL
jgi:hypothetical protein